MQDENREKRHQNRYSVSFKMKVVEEIENGLISQYAATRLYGIPSATLVDWVKRYGYNTKIDKVVYVMTAEEERELYRLRKENASLNRALEDSHLRNIALESLIEVADKKYGFDLKKNFGAQLSEELKKKLGFLVSKEED